MDMGRLLILLCSLHLVGSSVLGQAEWKTVSKKMEQVFPFQKALTLNVDGEKAEVKVQTWEKPLVRVQLEMLARHPDRDIAARDLEKVIFSAQQVKNQLYVRNYIEESEANIKAHIRVIYLIFVPPTCPVYLRNHYGSAQVRDLTGDLRIHSRFSQIGLDNICGNMRVETIFGDVFANDLHGDLYLNARRSDMILQNIFGHVDILAEFGVLRLQLDDVPKSLNLVASQSEVYLLGIHPWAAGMDIQVKNGQLDFPSHPKIQVREQRELGLKSLLVPSLGDAGSKVTIRLNLGDVKYLKKP